MTTQRDLQMETLQAVFARCRIDGGVPGVLVHGACVGVDITAAILAYCRGWRVHALPAATRATKPENGERYVC